MIIRLLGLMLAGALSLTACSGGQSAPLATHAATGQGPQPLVTTTFVFVAPPASAAAAVRAPKYVTANIASIKIAVTSVNGGTPAVVTASVTTNLTLATCPCTVSGPAVPPGNDAFTLTAYDAQNGGGNVVSTASPTLTIVAGQANNNTITLNGVPASVTIAGLPSGTAGTAFGASAFSVTVKDADGNTIMGTYEHPIALSDSDVSGATTLATSGSDGPPAGQLVSSSDVGKLSYSGLAIVPATISAAATGATTSNVTFAPALQAIVTTAPLNGSTPEIALTRDTASGAFTASEVGWTNAPYNRSLTVSAAGACSTIGTTAPGNGTAFTATAVAAPASGTCALTVSDFTGGSIVALTLAYVSGSQTFSYTGAQQNFTVPFGVTTVTVAAAGAQGGTGNGGATPGGDGGSVTATIPATAASTLAIFVGGAGGSGGGGGSGAGGYNGGAAGGTPFWAAGGGGASGVSISGTWVVVVGGGGGGSESNPGSGTGGDGGGLTGQSGSVGNLGGAGGGGGTTSGTGGAGGGSSQGGNAGAAGVGGSGATGAGSGGGGGGGYYGGGGGGSSGTGGGGGGGSSFVEATAIGAVTNTQGGHTGNGSITISW